MATHELKKRTKPCANCKRNKVKCLYKESLPCARCLKHNLKCYFPYEVPSVGVEAMQQQEIPLESVSTLTSNKSGWVTSVDHRLNTFENALESVLALLHTSQNQQQQQIKLLQQQISEKQHSFQYNAQPQVALPSVKDLESQLISEFSDQQRGGVSDIKDFRDSPFISVAMAEELLEIFSQKLAPHMYGYDVSDLNGHELWNDSPILLAAICTVACAHHSCFAQKTPLFRASLEWFTSQLLLRPDKCTHIEHTILALIIAAMWLESGQMFTAVAIQLARINRIDQFDQISFKSQKLWKLWYLLYIVDGNQNLTFHKSPSIYQQTEPIIQKCRSHTIEQIPDHLLKSVLIENDNANVRFASNRQLELLNEVGHDKIPVTGPSLKDIRMLAQLEYHVAMEAVFHNKYTKVDSKDTSSCLEASMVLVEPSAFGIPWENNVDLDRWMISWTIALQNINIQNDAWCLKSTLLYYNFARMHINTKPLLEGKKSALFEGSNSKLIELWHISEESETSRLSLKDKLNASREISYSAAISLLKLATNDHDIRNIFQFLPIHVYVMLYYATLVVLNPSEIPTDDDKENTSRHKKAWQLVAKFRDMASSNSFSDMEFKHKLVDSLNQILQNFKKAYSDILLRQKNLHNPIEEVDQILDGGNQNEIDSQKPRSILAWPGTNHGHP